MKTLFAAMTLGILTLLAGCSTSAQSHASRSQQLYDNEVEKVGSMHKSGALTRREANMEMVSISKSYFPNDPLLIST